MPKGQGPTSGYYKNQGKVLELPGIDYCPDPPEQLGKYAKEKWIEITTDLTPHKVLRITDLPLLEVYSSLYQAYRDIQEQINIDGYFLSSNLGIVKAHPGLAVINNIAGKMSQIGMQFGLSAKARGQIRLGDKPTVSDDQFNQFIEGSSGHASEPMDD